MVGLETLRNDGNEEGGILLIDSGAALSACSPLFCAGTPTKTHSRNDFFRRCKWSNGQKLPSGLLVVRLKTLPNGWSFKKTFESGQI